MSKKRAHSRPDWRAPTILITSFVAAVGLALGHHLFYWSPKGTTVTSAAFDQRFDLQMGTALAFLTRAALIITIGTSFTQILWRDITNTSLRLSTIDSLTSLCTSLVEVFALRDTWRHPELICLAVVSWSLPIASIITPGTLTVGNTTEVITKSTNVPIIDMEHVTHGQGYCYNKTVDRSQTSATIVEWEEFSGPIARVLRLTTSTAFRGSLPNLIRPSPHSSFDLQFDAPALSCTEAALTILYSQDPCLTPGNDSFVCNRDPPKQYLAWAPPPPMSDSPWKFAGEGALSSDVGPAVMYVASRQSEGWELLNCSLWRATYGVHFEFDGETQSVDMSKLEYHGDMGVQWSRQCNSASAQLIWNYQSLMQSFGTVVKGSLAAGVHSENVTTMYQTSNVLNTELAFAGNLRKIYATQGNLEKIPDFAGIPDGGDLAPALERLFQNMTLGLFASKEFLNTNRTLVDVTTRHIHKIYEYDWRRLATAYGVAISAAFVALTLGLLVLFRTGLSYTHKFSTIMRATRGAHFDSLVDPSSRFGADPLPPGIEDAKVRVGSVADEETELLVNGRNQSKRVGRGAEM